MTDPEIYLHLDTGDRFSLAVGRAPSQFSFDTNNDLRGHLRERCIGFPEASGNDVVVPVSRIAFIRVVNTEATE